jgi:hypothetical protein
MTILTNYSFSASSVYVPYQMLTKYIPPNLAGIIYRTTSTKISAIVCRTVSAFPISNIQSGTLHWPRLEIDVAY